MNKPVVSPLECTASLRAKALAEQLHQGQVDKAGAPYIQHLERVAAILVRRFPDATDAEIEAAWLHDAIEDTGITAEGLVTAGIDPKAVTIVERLTKPEGVVYLEWIGELARNAGLSAVRVKLADNEDNRDPARVALLANGAEMVNKRYEPARVILEKALSVGPED